MYVCMYIAYVSIRIYVCICMHVCIYMHTYMYKTHTCHLLAFVLALNAALCSRMPTYADVC